MEELRAHRVQSRMGEGKMSEVLENKVSWSQRGVRCEEGRQGDGRTGSREEETDAIGRGAVGKWQRST